MMYGPFLTDLGWVVYRPQNLSHFSPFCQPEEANTSEDNKVSRFIDSSMSLCKIRLQEERKQWRKDHPFGFYARPTKNEDGSLDLTSWTAGIPGKPNTLWSDAVYPITIHFPEEYPSKPPKVKFPGGFYHPNVYPSGTVCLSILNEEQDWRPAITLKQIVLGVQELLNNPNPDSPAQEPAWKAFSKDRAAYEKKVREQVKRYANAA